MRVVRRSPVSGKTHEMDLPITYEQVKAYRVGTLIQDAFPDLTPGQREFFKTGITPEEWARLFGEKERDSA